MFIDPLTVGFRWTRNHVVAFIIVLFMINNTDSILHWHRLLCNQLIVAHLAFWVNSEAFYTELTSLSQYNLMANQVHLIRNLWRTNTPYFMLLSKCAQFSCFSLTINYKNKTLLKNQFLCIFINKGTCKGFYVEPSTWVAGNWFCIPHRW